MMKYKDLTFYLFSLTLTLISTVTPSAIKKSVPLPEIHRIKSLKFEFTDSIGSIEWDLDLAQVAEKALELKSFIKLDIHATEPIKFAIKKCRNIVLAKSSGFYNNTLYIDVPWLEFFLNEANKPCLKGPHELSLEVNFGYKGTSGYFSFSESTFTPHDPSPKQTTSIQFTNLYSGMISMKNLLRKALIDRRITTLIAIVSETVEVKFGKCGVDDRIFDMKKDTPLLFRGELLDHLYRLNFLYCDGEPWKWMFNLTISSPNSTGFIAFDVVKNKNPRENFTLVSAVLILLVLFLILVWCFVGLLFLQAIRDSMRMKETAKIFHQMKYSAFERELQDINGSVDLPQTSTTLTMDGTGKE
ncbi:hypothetical protein GCK72_013024 [Caenorhabditis remanei]|uniref:Uncharacterized protein n=1 Tax=Caenorhabditis remanei TaxID=31234 RepID=A0A6A5GPC9_CAERE|nr:hypothetical protein GCK72_013024 [Caenorhabditis remanei]KAF1756571.1 hypothetical protein GCK72_013024 [Caenorhabditis remanei]